ncbi:hypothetical protein BGW36DRAFT_126328 [Talaromyces proteolyticus]|uniref:Uncharacterized protein n=1 Tax=Talaromyces proteolyticus TaxID=1131652 RepID=A0AAD4KW30_9EURO|nr:uncharacterized protein BGW36DRAFT_126328 [Talaromyces proteolyticus]KAH8700292.1 hypothetical protein BGW36DRAFT_126328 [Talaromyces proteolyticus]
MSQPNGQNVERPRLTAESLAQIPAAVAGQTGLQKYRESNPADDPYHLPPRNTDRDAHKLRLEEQVDRTQSLF